MRRPELWCFMIVASGVLALPDAAHAAMTVFGTPETVKCFQRAEAGSSLTQDCDSALKDEGLTERDRASTLVNRGIIYNNGGKVEKALADFNAALAIDANIAEAYLNRGNSRFYQKRFEDAVADYTRAIDLKIDRLGAAYYDRSLAYGVLGRLDEAKADLEASLEADPDFAPAKSQLAALNKVLKQQSTAPEMESATPQ